MNKKIVNPMVTAAEECLASELTAAKTNSVKEKLQKLSAVCRSIVVEQNGPLSIAAAAKDYNRRFPEHGLSEQTIRNGRPGGNPYLTLVRAWQTAAIALAARAPTGARQDGGAILRESDLHAVKDPLIRHQMVQLFSQNRSLHNMLNILKAAHGKEAIRLAGAAERPLPELTGDGLVLTSAEIEALRDFIDPRKLKAKHLKGLDSDAVTTVDGQAIADPGFMSALRKIVKSYELPEQD